MLWRVAGAASTRQSELRGFVLCAQNNRGIDLIPPYVPAGSVLAREKFEKRTRALLLDQLVEEAGFFAGSVPWHQVSRWSGCPEEPLPAAYREEKVFGCRPIPV